MNRRLTYSRLVECLQRGYAWTCRFFGLLAVIGLWGVGSETLYDGHSLGIYLQVVAAIISFTELIYLVHFWLNTLIRNEQNPCLMFWTHLLWLDNWKKGVLYLLLSVGCFVCPRLWMALITGAMVVVSSLLYFLKTFVDQITDSANPERTGECETPYSRFQERIEELTENFEDTEVNEDEFASALPSFALAEQDEILTV